MGDRKGLYKEDDILSIELIEDGETVSATTRGLGTAAAGALAFGGVGLVAGALIGGKKVRETSEVSEIFLEIKTSRRNYPLHRITLFQSKKPVNQSNANIKEARRSGENVVELFRAIQTESSNKA